MQNSDLSPQHSLANLQSWKRTGLSFLALLSLASCGGDSGTSETPTPLRCAVITEHEQTATGVNLSLQNNALVFLDGTVQPDPGINDSGGRGWDILRYSLPQGASFHLDADSPAVRQISFGPIAGQKVNIESGQSHEFLDLPAGEYTMEILPSGKETVAVAITSDLCRRSSSTTKQAMLQSYVTPGIMVTSMPQPQLYSVDAPSTVDANVASELAFAELVIKTTLQSFVFSSNNALTWQMVNQALTSQFTQIYEEGLLFQGATPEQAFQVTTGPSVDPLIDELFGTMIVEILLNLKGTLTPIELTVSQNLTTS